MNASPQVSDSNLHDTNGMDQFLTFVLAGEHYGVDILRVQEIKGWEGVTPMPNMPDAVLGIINLRGTVVPVIDLRRHFRMADATFDKTTVVIVVKVRDEEHGERTMGIVVDAVSEVHNIPKEDLKPAPEFGDGVDSDAIRGLASIDERMIIMLDIDRLLRNGIMKHIAFTGNAA
ncbi:MAG: chemotaxis protein CheW [Gammaproteobacteria bacterium]|nr:MAG: chemotaxis protein CheW [Gammaproteobacteria bacterium]PIE36859.1 MAG: chemotaxis protein CheW [Gammaproteobacteria bacterium]